MGGAIILVSITLFAIMCFRVKYEKFSRRLFGRPEGDAADKDLQDDLYVDLTDNSPDLIPNDGKQHELKSKQYYYEYYLINEMGRIKGKYWKKQEIL